MAVPTPLASTARCGTPARRSAARRTRTGSTSTGHFGDGTHRAAGARATLAETLRAGELELDVVAGEPVVRYHDQLFPIWTGTEGGRVEQVLERQRYLLASWREKDAVLGYRRFFDVDTLIAVRVELDDVFDATHRVLLDLYDRGVVDGFRIDHPDGLADPEGYLARLRDATDGAWVVVEKILDGRASSSPSVGRRRHDRLRRASARSRRRSLRRPAVSSTSSGTTSRVADATSSTSVEHEAKALVVRDLLEPEVERLTRAATAALRPLGRAARQPARCTRRSTAAARHVEVYRAYVRLDEPSPTTVRRDRLDDDGGRARARVAPTARRRRRCGRRAAARRHQRRPRRPETWSSASSRCAVR